MRKSLSPEKLVVCINNTEYAASIEKRKIYAVLADPAARAKHLLRVIDESGEDYLYPEKYFLPIHLPKEEQKVIAHMY